MTAHPHLPVADIAAKFDEMHWPSLNKVHLTAEDISPVINKIAEQSGITLTQIGTSYEDRPVSRFTLGSGKCVILAWTQMHGDEATATAAVLDWLHILLNGQLNGLPANWQSQVTLHVIPMLNPDGAQRRTRVNAQGIDINRDARTLQSPEGQILQQQVATLAPDIAFNLHDQNPYYTTGVSSNPATIAFLAPAYHEDKHVDGPRLRAKQLIAHMAGVLSHFIPQCIGRYDDTYSFRSFGDNIAASGASTILIESGAAINDPNRQIARKMNVIGLQTALESLLTNQFTQYSLADYYRIPDNREDGLCDVKIHDVTLGYDKPFVADISIVTDRKTGKSRIEAIGDLRTVYGFENIDATGLAPLPPKAFTVQSPLTLTNQSYKALLSQGYSYFIDENALLNIDTTLPVLVSDTDKNAPAIMPGEVPNFVLQHVATGEIKEAVILGERIVL